MTFDELKLKYPNHPVKQDPLIGCPQCDGTGETRKHSVCLCACLSEQDDEIRRAAVIAFKQAYRKAMEAFRSR